MHVIESRLNSQRFLGQPLLSLCFQNEIHYCTLTELKRKKKKKSRTRVRVVAITHSISPPFSAGLVERQLDGIVNKSND